MNWKYKDVSIEITRDGRFVGAIQDEDDHVELYGNSLKECKEDIDKHFALKAADVAVDLKAIAINNAGAFWRGSVIGINRNSRVVRLSPKDDVDLTTLIPDTGLNERLLLSLKALRDQKRQTAEKIKEVSFYSGSGYGRLDAHEYSQYIDRLKTRYTAALERSQAPERQGE